MQAAGLNCLLKDTCVLFAESSNDFDFFESLEELAWELFGSDGCADDCAHHGCVCIGISTAVDGCDDGFFEVPGESTAQGNDVAFGVAGDGVSGEYVGFDVDMGVTSGD